MSRPVRELLTEATARLAAAGVGSPAADARRLLAYAAGLQPSRLLLLDSVADDVARLFTDLDGRRARRVPLQHLTGVAHFRHLDLAVGPGVFVPRPETEVMTGWAIDRLRELRATRIRPDVRADEVAPQSIRVVELCAGSGAISAALATEIDWAAGELDLHAVELSEDAAAWAARNLAGTGATLHVTDMADALPGLDGSVDLLIANPPYIPLEAYESVEQEVRDHDPALALWSGDDGLDAVRVVVAQAARLLRPAGLLTYEHAEVQAESAPAVAVASGAFETVRDHPDLTGRARFVTAVRTGSARTAR